MSGKYKGTQAHLSKNPFAVFSLCACHSLNLCGSHAAECCTQATQFFGIVQELYNIFSNSPMQWKILQTTLKIYCIHYFIHNEVTEWKA